MIISYYLLEYFFSLWYFQNIVREIRTKKNVKSVNCLILTLYYFNLILRKATVLDHQFFLIKSNTETIKRGEILTGAVFSKQRP